MELHCTAIGPDLRWTQCQVERTQRSSGSSQQQGTQVYGDEEPF